MSAARASSLPNSRKNFHSGANSKSPHSNRLYRYTSKIAIWIKTNRWYYVLKSSPRVTGRCWRHTTNKQHPHSAQIAQTPRSDAVSWPFGFRGGRRRPDFGFRLIERSPQRRAGQGWPKATAIAARSVLDGLVSEGHFKDGVSLSFFGVWGAGSSPCSICGIRLAGPFKSRLRSLERIERSCRRLSLFKHCSGFAQIHHFHSA